MPPVVKKVIKKAVKKDTTAPELEKPKQANQEPKIDPDFLHLIARDLYITALIKDDGRVPKKNGQPFPPSHYDRDCVLYIPSAIKVIEILIQYGYLKREDLIVDPSVPIKAEDCGTNGIPRWIKDKYIKQN